MKCVLNKCYGGFRLSKEASELYNKRKGLTGKEAIDVNYGYLSDDSIKSRCDPILVQVVEELGEKASGQLGRLRIVDIPDDISDPYMDNYDGIETIREGREW